LLFKDEVVDTFYLHTKFGARSFIHSKVIKGSQILKLGHMNLTPPTSGYVLFCDGSTRCVECVHRTRSVYL